MRVFLSLSAIGLALTLLSACGSDPPTFPDVVYDSGLECSDGEAMDGGSGQDLGPCPAGQLCLQGRCYDECSGAAECAATEMCMDGRCIPRTTPVVDAGPMDTGPPDPCDGVTCEGGEMCHPTGGVCVECLGMTCAAGAPICDLAFGTCTAFNPRFCSPCNVDGDCVEAGSGTSYGDCVMREGDYERVCVPTCTLGTDCAPGLDCGSDGRCAPRVGSCAGFLAAVDLKPCLDDAECIPLGSTQANQCGGTMPPTVGDGGMLVPSTCRQPCGIPGDCPTGAACIAGFCLPM